MRYLGKTASSPLFGSVIPAWAVLMLIVWALFVPRRLPIDTFTLLTLTGPLVFMLGQAAGPTRPLLRKVSV